MPRLPGFISAFPDIDIEMHFSDSLIDLAADGIDIAIRSGELSGWPSYVSREVLQFSWVAWVIPPKKQRVHK
ncbi:hypothetical protein BN1221_00494c [Brenneria goodwinii]|uniref:LysR substrate-binding domain-containing protein n=2 Tax=Brenneria goodwinii TaxID=1109412 RepID=A0A0G4JQ95_9GAMM|nr:hypothetical protein BN1221_00494c [Brenneria goodwinii]